MWYNFIVKSAKPAHRPRRIWTDETYREVVRDVVSGHLTIKEAAVRAKTDPRIVERDTLELRLEGLRLLAKQGGTKHEGTKT